MPPPGPASVASWPRSWPARRRIASTSSTATDPCAGPGSASGSAGMRLLRLVPGAGWRIVLAVVAIGVPLLLLLFGRGRLQFAGMALLGILIALFSPGRRRPRRW